MGMDKTKVAGASRVRPAALCAAVVTLVIGLVAAYIVDTREFEARLALVQARNIGEIEKVLGRPSKLTAPWTRSTASKRRDCTRRPMSAPVTWCTAKISGSSDSASTSDTGHWS